MTNDKTPAIIEKAKTMMPEEKKFLSANPYEMNFKQEAGFAIMAIQNNPFLLNCTPDSMKSAIINVALTGISLNPALKYAYLVPRSHKVDKDHSEIRAVLDISYIGMIKILTDAGAVKSVDSEVVYENDHFVWSKGSKPILEHMPDFQNDRGKPYAAYAIAYFRDGGFQFEVMAKSDIEKIRATSESWKNEKVRQFSPWETWTDEMWKKTVLKRLFKILPKTNFNDQLITALSTEHKNEIEDINNKNDFLSNTFSDVDDEIQDADEQDESVESDFIVKDVPEELFQQTQKEIKEQENN